LNFQNAGYDSDLAIPNLGMLFYIISGHVALFIISFLLFLLSKLIPKASLLNSKLSKYLYWNGMTRFFIEAYMDIALFTALNLQRVDWSTDFFEVNFNNCIAVGLMVFIGFLPIFFVFFYAYNMSNWKNDDF
jgi:hypothetical protein